MGLEYHERRRDKYGRFTGPVFPAKEVQIHVRLKLTEHAALRKAAIDTKTDMRGYVAGAVRARLQAEGYLTEDG